MNVVRTILFISIGLISCTDEVPKGSETDKVYEYLENFSWGYVDENGILRIGDTYEMVHDFSEGIGLVKEDELWYFIDNQGSKLFLEAYREARPFVHALAVVSIDENEFYLINKKGETQSTTFDEIIFHNAKSVIARKDGALSVYDFEGNVLIPDNFEPVKLLPHAVIIRHDTKSGIVSNKKLVALPIYDKIIPFQKEFFLKKDSSWYLMKENSKVVELPYDNILVGEKNIAVNNSKGWRILDAYQKPVSNRYYSQIHPIGHSFWLAVDSSGYFLTNGRRDMKERFDMLGKVSDGLASFEKDGRWGFIDTNGQVRIAPKFQMVWDFSEGYARVVHQGNFYWVNTNGTLKKLKTRVLDLRDLKNGLAKAQIYRE